MKIYSALYNDWAHLDKFGTPSLARVPEDLDEKEGILILHGGEDISPSLYGETSVYSYAPNTPSKRDQLEKALFEKAVELGYGIVGICRGAQLACALSGGRLVQDVNNHAGGGHLVDTVDGDQFHTTSAHHQMMVPWKIQHELLGWSAKRLANEYNFGKSPEFMVKEPEIVFFNATNTLGIQGHPEWMAENSGLVQYMFKQVEERFL